MEYKEAKALDLCDEFLTDETRIDQLKEDLERVGGVSEIFKVLGDERARASCGRFPSASCVSVTLAALLGVSSSSVSASSAVTAQPLRLVKYRRGRKKWPITLLTMITSYSSFRLPWITMKNSSRVGNGFDQTAPTFLLPNKGGLIMIRELLIIAKSATPTSANTASHRLAMPSPPKSKTVTFTAKATMMFCQTTTLVRRAIDIACARREGSSLMSTASAASSAASAPNPPHSHANVCSGQDRSVIQAVTGEEHAPICVSLKLVKLSHLFRGEAALP